MAIWREGAHRGVPGPTERLPGQVKGTGTRRGEAARRKVEPAGALSCSGEGGRPGERWRHWASSCA
jgi:hypothetical protein